MADLSDLVLLRNDPEMAERLIAQAAEADRDAQYAAGLIYAEGRGVNQSDALAYFWLTLAIEQGDEDAELLRMVVLSNISQEEFDLGILLLDKYHKTNYLKTQSDNIN